MVIRRKLLLSAGLLLLGSVLAAPSHAGIKCWTDKHGDRACGDSVPPEYSQEGHEVLNQQGIVIKEQAAAKTPQQLAAERKKKEQEAAAERKREAQAKRDRVLLDTFSSEDDLKLARDGKLAAIESQIKLTEGQLDKLQHNLDDSIKAAAQMERQGKEPSKQIKENIANVRKQIAENQQFIASKRLERKHVRARFAADIKRFRELKAEQKSDDE